MQQALSPWQHRTVLLHEAVDGLWDPAVGPHPQGVYVDATFGRGGHSRLILSRLGPEARLIALDRDPEAIAHATQGPDAIADPRFQIVHAPFSSWAEVITDLGLGHVQGLLMDIGVSSPQIDNPERGFSFRFDAPLDMRMDPSGGEPAAAWLARASEEEIRKVIKNYGEERFAGPIAKAIVAARTRERIDRTVQLARIVAAAVRTREVGQDPATRTFQALRIHVNQELEELSLALPQALELLHPGGRLAAISFHSLEDRIVKRFLQSQARPEVPERLPLKATEMPQPRLKLVGKLVRPTSEEVNANPRARSAILRVAEKIR